MWLRTLRDIMPEITRGPPRHPFSLADIVTEFWYILVLAAMLGGFWLWSDTLSARERALQVCRRACQRVDAQLLDDTVALRRMALREDAGGRRAIWRLYRFEFTIDGATRRPGFVALLGRGVQHLELDYPEGTLIDDLSARGDSPR